MSASPRLVCPLLASLAVLTASACSKNDSGFPGRDGYDAIMRAEPEPAGAHCVEGGTAVHFGLDQNRDGVLQDSEISGQPTYVCNGVTGAGTDGGGDGPAVALPMLMSSDTEPKGTHCAAGGQALHWGADLNGDGVLQWSEVTGTTYVCNGAPGSNGHNTLAAMEAAGSTNCPTGGTAIKTGLDGNDDGLLQAAEVASTSYVCNGTTGKQSLVRQEDAPVGGTCLHGGRRILSGVDTDGNGYLEDVEAIQKMDVCNGAPGEPGEQGVPGTPGTPGQGHVTVFKLVPSPEGVCATGGTRIEIGLDLNDDTALADSEINSSSDVCNGVNGTPGAPGEQGEQGEPGTPGTPGTNGYNALAVASPEAASGGHCAYGGQRIETGLDANRDGVLQSGEITGIRYVCNGAATAVRLSTLTAGNGGCAAGGQLIESGVDANGNGALDTAEITGSASLCNGVQGTVGLNSLVSVSTAGGGSCANGGQRIDIGLDDNRDEVLQSDEIDSIHYVCNGATGAAGDAGAPGDDGLNSLVKVTAEAPGANCPAGGQRIDSGLDENASTALDDDEITNTQYVCNGGNVVMRVGMAMWGGVCRAGGVRVDSGLDKNANAVLDDSEITNTQYVCNAWVAAIGAGQAHSCALMANGSNSWVTCWGDNQYGQLGDGTNTSRNTPVTVAGLTDVAKLAVGLNHTCVYLNSGTAVVKCWGRNDRGQLGDGTTISRNAPVTVPGVNGYILPIDISAGGTSLLANGGAGHTCVVLGSNVVYCWGDDVYGQLGDGGNALSATPVQVTVTPTGTLGGALKVACGGAHTCVTNTAGSVQCWGYNSSGQVGNGTSVTQRRAVSVAGPLNNVESLSAGGAHTCARMSDGSLRCWGSNVAKQINNLVNGNFTTPQAITGVTNTTSIGMGEQHSCAVTRDGGTVCWGRNLHGQMGDGTTGPDNGGTPGAVLALSGAISVRGGSDHTCAVTSGGLAFCWGYNSAGQLGDGASGDRVTPVQVLLFAAP